MIRDVGESSVDGQSHADNGLEEVPEYSQQSELRRCRHKGGSKSRRVMNTRSSKKALLEDASAIPGKSPCNVEGEMSKYPAYFNEGSQVETSIAEETVGKVQESGIVDKLRRRLMMSWMLMSVNNNLKVSQQVGIGRGVTRVLQLHKTQKRSITILGGRRLSRNSVGTSSTADACVDDGKRTEGEVSGDGGPVDIIPNPEVASTRVMETASDNGNPRPLVQVTTCKKFEVQEVSSHRVAKIKAPTDGFDDNVDAAKSVQNLDLSEEIVSTTEYHDEYDHGSTFHNDDDGGTDDVMIMMKSQIILVKFQ